MFRDFYHPAPPNTKNSSRDTRHGPRAHARLRASKFRNGNERFYAAVKDRHGNAGNAWNGFSPLCLVPSTVVHQQISEAYHGVLVRPPIRTNKFTSISNIETETV